MRRVRLYGEAARLFGREFRFSVARTRTAGDVARAIAANRPEFRRYLATAHERGVGFRVVVRDRDLSEKECGEPLGRHDLAIVPTPFGAKSATAGAWSGRSGRRESGR